MFEIPIYTEADCSIPKPLVENYDYWIPLLEYFLAKSNTFDIHCWNDEKDTILEIVHKFNKKITIVKEENLTIMKGLMDAEVSSYLLSDITNKEDYLKWFTINLYLEKHQLFHSEHWGTEFFIPNIKPSEVHFIKKITPNHTKFHSY